MKKAAMGMQTKPKKGKMISESGDLADALNETMRMRKAGTVPKTGKDAGKFMDKLNKEGKLGPKMKMGGAMKKAKNGTEFGMLSVKAGIDKNPNPTAADRIAGATKGKSMMKMGGKMAKQAAIAIAMKKAGKAPKKAMMGASMMDTPMMKKGGAMKKCKYGCK